MNGHQVALWAGGAAFFTTVLAIGAIDVLNPDDRVQFLGGVVVGTITAGAVYAKQRLDDVKRIRGQIVVRETDDKLTFTLELQADPEEWVDNSEVVFRVIRSE